MERYQPCCYDLQKHCSISSFSLLQALTMEVSVANNDFLAGLSLREEQPADVFLPMVEQSPEFKSFHQLYIEHFD